MTESADQFDRLQSLRTQQSTFGMDAVGYTGLTSIFGRVAAESHNIFTSAGAGIAAAIGVTLAVANALAWNDATSQGDKLEAEAVETLVNEVK